MKKILFITSMLIVQLGFAQLTIKKSTIDSGGQIAQVGSIEIISTIGEVVVQEKTQGTIHISEGFISPDIQSVLAIEDYTSLEGVVIFPNPTVDFININTVNSGRYTVFLYDLNGSILLNKSFNSNEIKQIHMKPYAVSTYLLIIKNTETQRYKTFKIIKK